MTKCVKSSEGLEKNLNEIIEIMSTEDATLFEVKASERSLCFRFGIHLVDMLKDCTEYSVDMEYNRSESYSKRFRAGIIDASIKKDIKYLHDELKIDVFDDKWLEGEKDISDAENQKLFVPDLIVHKRNVSNYEDKEANLIVLEFKTSNNKKDVSIAYDLFKLKLSKLQFGYAHAFFICLRYDKPKDSVIYSVDESKLIIDMFAEVKAEVKSN